MGNSATIKDIAKECGVSIATVSRVINGSPRVLPETKEKIENAIKKYDYVPNAIAKSLVSKRSTSIGVTLPDISNPYFSGLFCEIEALAHQKSYSVFLCNTMFRSDFLKDMPIQKEQDYFQMLIEAKVAGAVIAGGQLDLLQPDSDYLTALSHFAKAVPLVILGHRIPGVPAIFIEQEENTGMVQALHFLHSLGHERIAFLGGENGVTITKDRLQAYNDTLKDLRLPIDPSLVVLTDYYVSDGYAAAKQLIEKRVPFTAVMAINDSVAIGAFRAFSDYGLRVPDDVSLISCEEFQLASYYTPRLTTINRHRDILGQNVIQTLLSCIQGDAAAAPKPAVSELMVRESCASPKEN